MKKYNVIWFDDEYLTLNIIKEKATLNDINLIGFDNAQDGIKELKRLPLSYDAVIVDGKFLKKPGQTSDTIDDSALFDVAVALMELSSIKKTPWFILSGQISFTKEKNRYADGFKNNKVYDKTKDEDLLTLWHDLKIEADLQEETQIRHSYQRVFEVCDDKYIGNDTAKSILQMLKFVENVKDFQSTEDLFNSIRKIIEKVFTAFYNLGLIPEEIYKGKGWINNSSKFLAGKLLSYKLEGEILHPTIAFSIKNILQVIQDASHSEGELSLRVDQHVKELSTPYLYKSLVYQLLDVLIWFKSYADRNPNIKINKSLWSKLEEVVGDWQDGIVISLSSAKGYAFFKPNNGTSNAYIHHTQVTDNELVENDHVTAIIEEFEDNKTKEVKKKVKEIRKIKI